MNLASAVAAARVRGSRGPRSEVCLTGQDAGGTVVFSETLSWDDFYDGTHEVIDSSEFRSAQGIVVLQGRIWDSTGVLSQEFENRYAPDGTYAGGIARFSDGTVQRD